jgi:predicted secreted protein
MSGAKLGFGAKLKRGNGASPEVFSDIAELTSLSGPNLSAETVDVTNLDSVSGYREHIAGLIDGGEVTCEGNYLGSNTSQNNLRSDLESRAVHTYRVSWPFSPAKTATFDAYVTAFGFTTPIDAQMAFSATLKITGPVTWA